MSLSSQLPGNFSLPSLWFKAVCVRAWIRALPHWLIPSPYLTCLGRGWRDQQFWVSVAPVFIYSKQMVNVLSVVLKVWFPRPTVSASPGIWLEMHMFQAPPQTYWIRISGWSPVICLNKASRWLWHSLLRTTVLFHKPNYNIFLLRYQHKQQEYITLICYCNHKLS